ncbi:RNA recognition motif domain-containing protein [Tautonia plasticadhaerens]|uniref:RRM domain-containing protein n=1 Tax=Tautonia plasticadhaerens TaxID=2527974 RepID=A0A518HEP9_9BACT|nr:RNA-binding protein [Tautonia plasticadhaerens]QDV39323.1 hypothetical protein ElP_72870 [Tautonia plasticadhaerens]
MDDLRQAFEQTLGIPFSVLPIPDRPIVRIFDGPAMLYGTREAKERPVLYSGQVDSIAAGSYPGYFLVGAWGHGVNSFAFYYARDDGCSRLYFRLAHGGAYMDNEAQAAKIAKFLPDFFAFEAERIREEGRILAIDAMYWGMYRVARADGVWEYFGSVFGESSREFDGFLTEGSCFVCVDGLRGDASLHDLDDLFRPFGEVRYRWAEFEPDGHRIGGACCVVMGSVGEARAAIAALHDREFHGRRLKLRQPSGIDAWR